MYFWALEPITFSRIYKNIHAFIFHGMLTTDTMYFKENCTTSARKQHFNELVVSTAERQVVMAASTKLF